MFKDDEYDEHFDRVHYDKSLDDEMFDDDCNERASDMQDYCRGQQ